LFVIAVFFCDNAPELQEEHSMESYRYLLDIALILLGTKLFGIFSKKLRMPAVVGALVAGIVLGPAMLNLVEPNTIITALSELGVIVIMFSAGLETSITDLRRAGFKAFIIALLGVIVPLIVGYIIGMFYNTGPEAWLENLFIGVIFTATSVGITVETLKEMHCMATESGNTILAAAVIDDVLGIICLTLVTGMADSSVNIGVVMLKILGFLVFAVVVGLVMHRFFAWWFTHDNNNGLQRYSIVSFAFALIMAWASEEFFGVADITGAFVAGLIISGTRQCSYVPPHQHHELHAHFPDLLREHRPETRALPVFLGTHRAHRRSLHRRGPHENHRLRRRRPALQIQPHAVPAHWVRHDFPWGGRADCRQQGHGPGPSIGVLRDPDPALCGIHDCHHACLPETGVQA
jgi:hypothetical protein